MADMLGQTLRIIRIEDNKQTIIFIGEGRVWRMSNNRDDCTDVLVTVEDICGDLDDLIGSPLLMCEKTTHENTKPQEITNFDFEKQRKWDDSFTWTFYKFATIKGSVTIRWYGSSNGYYSEEVELYEIDFHFNTEYCAELRALSRIT